MSEQRQVTRLAFRALGAVESVDFTLEFNPRVWLPTFSWLRGSIKRLRILQHIFTRRRLLALSIHAALSLECRLGSLAGLSLALFGFALPLQD